MTTKAPVVATTKPASAAKAKKAPSTKKTNISTSHPKYIEMIKEAITALKERTGSSQVAIAKFIEENHKSLPGNFRKQLLVQLKKLVASEKLVKVKNSYKIPSTRSVKAASNAPGKKKSVVAKAKTTTKKIAASVKAKPEAVKASVKTKPVGKVAKTSNAVAKKVAAVKKKVSAKTVKSPAKKGKNK